MRALRAMALGSVVVALSACSAHAVGTFRDEIGNAGPTTWQGVITGRELGTAAGVSAMKVTLTLAPEFAGHSVETGIDLRRVE